MAKPHDSEVQEDDSGTSTQTIKLPETALFVALMLYFGWVQASSYYRTLGIPFSILNITSQDFILNSVTFLSGLLPRAGITLLAIIFLEFVFRKSLGRLRSSWVSRGSVILLTLGLILVASSLFPNMTAAVGLHVDPVQNNLIFASGFGLMLEAMRLWGQLPLAKGDRRRMETGEARVSWREYSFWLRVIVIGMIVDGLIIAIAWIANSNGQAEAGKVLKCPLQLPGVTIYSNQPLSNELNKVSQDQVNTGTTTEYRYKSLRLVTHSGGEYFLISEFSQPNAATVLVVPDTTITHLEFTQPTTCP